MKKDDDIDPNSEQESLKKNWAEGSADGPARALFKPEELDVYVNKITYEAFIFHGKKIDYKAIECLEYDSGDYSLDIINKDGTRLDLGVKIQWLVRPYISKAQQINIVQTKNGKSIDGIIVPLIHKN